jgi:hypothetical protein
VTLPQVELFARNLSHGRNRTYVGAAWTVPPRGRGAAVKNLDAETLLRLLAVYESALRELAAMNDPAVSCLMRRLERRRAEVIAALADSWFPES